MHCYRINENNSNTQYSANVCQHFYACACFLGAYKINSAQALLIGAVRVLVFHRIERAHREHRNCLFCTYTEFYERLNFQNSVETEKYL